MTPEEPSSLALGVSPENTSAKVLLRPGWGRRGFIWNLIVQVNGIRFEVIE